MKVNSTGWVNDWARYRSTDANGERFEWSVKPFVCPGTGTWEASDVFEAAVVDLIHAGDWEASLEQRYTDQQLALEAEGWTINHSRKYPVDKKIIVDVYFSADRFSGEIQSNCNAADKWRWADEALIAWRPHNGEGYKDGVKIEPCTDFREQNSAVKTLKRLKAFARRMNRLRYNKAQINTAAKIKAADTEWAGGLPPVGAICELVKPKGYSLDDEGLWATGDEIEIIAHRRVNGMMLPIVYNKTTESANSLVRECIRPIQSEREKVIEKVLSLIKYEKRDDYRLEAPIHEYIENAIAQAYDVGCLKIPEGKESSG